MRFESFYRKPKAETIRLPRWGAAFLPAAAGAKVSELSQDWFVKPKTKNSSRKLKTENLKVKFRTPYEPNYLEIQGT
uniref:Uncharacterized protein n=1 Tax=Desulfobacca acetoxidans TaxID=60893 RepID=A0A7C3Z0M4_9BACT